MSNNAVLDNILTRRSCRAYTDRPVSKEDLDTILKAAIYAPSGMSRQSWQFTVIRKRKYTGAGKGRKRNVKPSGQL